MSMRILLFPTLLLTFLSAAQAGPAAPAGEVAAITCRALEVHMDDELKVAVVIFHQRNEAERSRLAALLRGYSGEMLELRIGDGTWRRARMVRLKSCFGRGLLFLPAPAPISERSEFLLRIPIK